MKIFVLGGTREAVEATEALAPLDEIVYSSATEYGAQIVEEKGIENVTCIFGKKDQDELYEYLNQNGIDAVVDAVHPFAAEASKNLIAASNRLGIPYIRYEVDSTIDDEFDYEDRLTEKDFDENDMRFAEQIDETIFFETAPFESQQEVCEYLQEQEGNILLTTGSKELEYWQQIDKDRLYIRVLPTPEVLKKCQDLGYKPSHIIAQQGPFTLTENVAQIERYDIKYLVTKMTNKYGGYAEKYYACLVKGIKLVEIKRPIVEYPNYVFDLDDLKKEINRIFGREPFKKVMFQGTGSSVGKSLISAALCRILYQDGLEVAPFKSQNMALNSYITKDGKEMGRAQVTQAECAGKEADVLMNPVLLKPNSDDGSQVIVNGEIWKTLKAKDYYSHKIELLGIVTDAFYKLSQSNDVLVIEGAGSPAEINLRDNDIVNMGFAETVDAPVILVCDIDKGGVFASLYGTIMLLEKEERERIAGYIINKFRGDEKLLRPGIDMIAEKFKEEGLDIPCLGVVPYIRLDIDDEDSITNRLDTRESVEKNLTIGVIRLKHFSNASDFTVFHAYDDIQLEYYDSYSKLKEANPDILIIPGSKNTIDDMKALRESKMADLILEKAESIPVIGICGGFQLMGEKICDPYHVESTLEEIEGLGLLEITTILTEEKQTTQTEGELLSSGNHVKGYQIHMGQTKRKPGIEAFARFSDGTYDGAVSRDKRHFGTYLHGLFDSDEYRDELLKSLGYRGEADFAYQNYKRSQYDKLADCLRSHLDMKKIYEILDNSIYYG